MTENPLFEETREPWRDELIDPHWIHDSNLGAGPIKQLENSEISFWRQLQEKYLAPLPNDADEKKRVSEELLELRNKVCLFYFLLNAIYIVILVVLSYVTSNQKELVIIVKCYINDPNNWEPLRIEPISLGFMGVFGILLTIQLFGMVLHRLSTFLHINASTKLGRKSSKLDDSRRKLEAARQLQKFDEGDEDETLSQMTDSVGTNKGGKLVRKLAKRHRKQPVAPGTLRARFLSNIQKVMQDNDLNTPFRGPTRLQDAVKVLREKSEVRERLQQIINIMKPAQPDTSKYSRPKLMWMGAYKKVKAQNEKSKETTDSRLQTNETQGRWKKLPRARQQQEPDGGIPVGPSPPDDQGPKLRASNFTEQGVRPSKAASSLPPILVSSDDVVSATEMFQRHESLY